MAQPTEQDVELARELLAAWNEGNGVSKSELERRTWNDGSSHGRHFDRFIRQTLGESTTRRSKQTDRIARLEDQLRGLGRHPDGASLDEWDEELQHSRRSCLAALRVWNDPANEFRTAGFALMFVTAWNALCIAILKRDDREWRKLDQGGHPSLFDGVVQAMDTMDLVAAAIDGDELAGTRENIRFWVDQRNAVAHRYLPTLDRQVIPHAQAGLLNFERELVERFGELFTLADSLSVPLQLAGFRDPSVMEARKAQQAALPVEVQAIMGRATDASPELLADETFLMRVAFIPVVPASGRNPDSVAYFVRPGEVPDELEETLARYVVVPKVARGPRPSMGAKQVVDEVGRRIPFRFNTNDHAEVGRNLGVRAQRDEEDKTIDGQFAEWFTAMKLYLYSQKWVDRLVQELTDVDRFEELTGRRPIPKA